MDINSYVDKIFFINMDKDVDRRNDILAQFQKHNITNYERISGVIIDDNTPKHCLFGPYNNAPPEKYYNGSVGCLLAHRKAIQMAKDRGYKKILILEDDIVIDDDFNKKFNKYISNFNDDVKYWNILYLGLCSWNTTITNTSFNDYLIRINGGGTCAFSYLVNSNIYDYLLANIDYVKCEIDLLYNNLNMQNCIHTYKLKEELVKHIHDNDSNIRI